MAYGFKSGGRQKGTKNKAKLPQAENFLKSFVDSHFDEAMAAWAQISDPKAKYECWLKAADFVYPRMRAMQVTGAEGGALEVVVIHEARKGDE